MNTLHSLLAELGIESPALHGQGDNPYVSQWVVDEPFIPELGHSYEITYGKVPLAGEERHVVKKVRIDGTDPGHWFDLDADAPLASHWQELPVKGFRPLD